MLDAYYDSPLILTPSVKLHAMATEARPSAVPVPEPDLTREQMLARGRSWTSGA